MPTATTGTLPTLLTDAPSRQLRYLSMKKRHCPLPMLALPSHVEEQWKPRLIASIFGQFQLYIAIISRRERSKISSPD
ncbi:hypothetical protein PanWU01x14_088560 [Parasponia andersonii]|uniref:Uncharacterized protein n=1 Tax=Parasponia andersonii TaxID=3476 RepID=A0A2P5D820_PARAD|nr:hypothetical protein PanWU01x14_088560 [Parasponia andersonii]